MAILGVNYLSENYDRFLSNCKHVGIVTYTAIGIYAGFLAISKDAYNKVNSRWIRTQI